MNTSKKVIIGIILFVYTLTIIGLTTMIVVPIANHNNPPTEQDCDCADDSDGDTDAAKDGDGDIAS